jgi:hypothetical protein
VRVAPQPLDREHRAVCAVRGVSGSRTGYLGDFPLFDFWPPYAVMLGYALCLVLAAGVVAGHLGASPALIAVASFLVQTHAAYAVTVLGALAFVVIGVWRHQRAALRSNERALFTALAVFGVFWALPLYAELFRSAGNVGALVRTFVGQPRFAWSASALLDRVALEFTGPFQYLLFGDRFIVPEAPKHFAGARVIALAQIGLLAFGFWRARRRSDRFVEALSLLCLLAVPCVVVALLGIRGDVAPHHTAWISAIGVIAFPVAVGGALPPHSWGRKILAARSDGSPRRVVPSVPARGARRDPRKRRGHSSGKPHHDRCARKSVLSADHQLERAGREGTRHPPAFEWAVALMLELEKRQVPFGVRSAPGLGWALGRARLETTAPSSYTIVISAGTARPLGRRLDCVEGGRNNLLRYPICAWARVEPASISASPPAE